MQLRTCSTDTGWIVKIPILIRRRVFNPKVRMVLRRSSIRASLAGRTETGAAFSSQVRSFTKCISGLLPAKEPGMRPL